MTTHEILFEKITSHEKIYLCSKKINAIRLAIIIFMSIAFAYEFYLLFWGRNKSALILTTAFVSAGLFFGLFYAWKASATAYIIGELMIVRFLSGTTKITGLESVRKIRLLNLKGISLTLLRFNLDGKVYTIIMHGKPPFKQDARTIIEMARNSKHFRSECED